MSRHADESMRTDRVACGERVGDRVVPWRIN